jgi:DNA-binding NarL/FixJ family response regulator
MCRKIVVPKIQLLDQQDAVEQVSQIFIGVVACHSLASRHLVELIKIHTHMTPFILTDGIKNPSPFPPNSQIVILIDLWGLPLPASEYLDAFSVTIPGCVFLALDRARNEIDVARFLQAGFTGFMTYDEALYLLEPAITAVAEGRVWTSPEVVRVYMDLTSQRTGRRGHGVETLTVRENQVLDLLRRRYTNKELANLLRISESTVKFHVSNVLTKLNVCNRRDLIENDALNGPRLVFTSHSLKKKAATVTANASSCVENTKSAVEPVFRNAATAR